MHSVRESQLPVLQVHSVKTEKPDVATEIKMNAHGRCDGTSSTPTVAGCRANDDHIRRTSAIGTGVAGGGDRDEREQIQRRLGSASIGAIKTRG